MLSIKIALQFLWRNFAKTCITLLAVALGFAIFYFILDVSSGLKYMVLHTTAETDGHIRIQTNLPYESFSDPDAIELRDELFSLSNEISDVSFSYRTLITYETFQDNMTFELRGFDFNFGAKISDIVHRINLNPANKIPENMTEQSPSYDGEIAVGFHFMDIRKFLQIGDIITVRNQLDQPFNLKIVAIFVSDQSALSGNVFFTTQETAQLIDGVSIFNFIEVRTHNPVNSHQVTPLLKDYSEANFTNYIINDWQEGNQTIINLLYIEDISVLLIQVMTGLAISFGVGSVIMFQAKQKINQIGILKALGVTDRESQLIFFYQALLITVIGLLLGLIIGVSLGAFFTTNFRRASGLPLVPLQTELINFYSILTISIMLPVNLIASLIPIRFVKNLKIIEVIKHE